MIPNTCVKLGRLLPSSVMRRSLRFAPLVALLVMGPLLALQSACRHPTTREGKPPKDREAQRGEVRLPDPLPLPENPKVASWIGEPSVAIAMVAPYSPVPLDLREGATQMFAQLTEPALAGELARALDLRAPFANVVLDDGQEVVRLSLTSEARTTLSGRLDELEKVGDFGAVRLPKPPPPPSADGSQTVRRAGGREWLAWIDEGDGGTLVLANSLEGLVTGRSLAAAYGQQPVFFTADPTQLAIPVEVPFTRVTGRGDLSAVTIEAQAVAGQNPFAELSIKAGTLGGLLDGSQISAGASSRYADHEDAVREVIVEVNSTVAQLPFLVRSIGEGIAAKLATALRTWDGRVLAAMGPAGHVRIAYGATDVEKSRVAVLRLLQAIVDNVSLARNFTNQVPKMTLRRKVAKVDGVDIEAFFVYDADSIASELRPLTDDEGRLNVAMAWSERAGGGMIVIGRKAQTELTRWLEETKGSKDHSATAAQLLAASFAADPEQLRPLLGSPSIDLEQLLALSAAGPRWQVTVADKGEGRYVIDVLTPGPPKPPRAR
jgi:hypothetical protein